MDVHDIVSRVSLQLKKATEYHGASSSEFTRAMASSLLADAVFGLAKAFRDRATRDETTACR